MKFIVRLHEIVGPSVRGQWATAQISFGFDHAQLNFQLKQARKLAATKDKLIIVNSIFEWEMSGYSRLCIYVIVLNSLDQKFSIPQKR